jgi:hypothetical protein
VGRRSKIEMLGEVAELPNPALQRMKACFNFRPMFNLGRDATGFAGGFSRPRGTLHHPGGAAFTAERQCR